MKRKIPSVLILTVMAIGFFADFPSSFAARKSLQGPLIQIGCKARESTVSQPAKWEKEEFNLQVRQSFTVKFRAKNGYFYNFLVEGESYPDESSAGKRLPRIKEFPPEVRAKYGNVVDKAAVEYLLREGFILDGKVYIVSAFAYQLELEGDIHRLRTQFERALK